MKKKSLISQNELDNQLARLEDSTLLIQHLLMKSTWKMILSLAQY